MGMSSQKTRACLVSSQCLWDFLDPLVQEYSSQNRKRVKEKKLKTAAPEKNVLKLQEERKKAGQTTSQRNFITSVTLWNGGDLSKTS